MWHYSGTAGIQNAAPEVWPAKCTVVPAAGQTTLVVFIHPRCPCSRATVGEIGWIMAKAKGLVQAQVWFYRPDGEPEAWAHTDLWRSAGQIPGVSVAGDEGGVEAVRFNASVSGQTLLYDRDGRCVFNGGITSARGHSGDNAGRSAVLTLLHGANLQKVETPVFGCALSGAGSTSAPTPGLRPQS